MQTHTRLVDNATGLDLVPGDTVVSFRNEHYTLLGWVAPRNPSSTGRIIVTDPRSTFGEREFFPGVINATIIINDTRKGS